MISSASAPLLSSTRVERLETIVIGGGQAGLAVGHYLAAHNVDFVILDAERRTGDVWRRRWDSLRLFTPAAFSGLPGMVLPAPPSHLPDKDDVADYLERYADRFDRPVRHGTRVESLGLDGARYVARTGDTRFETDNVVVATGPFQRPRCPPTRRGSRPPFTSCTRVSTGARSTCLTARRSSSAPATPAHRSRSSSRASARCGWRAETRGICPAA